MDAITKIWHKCDMAGTLYKVLFLSEHIHCLKVYVRSVDIV